MNEKSKKSWIAVVVLLAVCLAAFVAGRASGRGQAAKEIEQLTDEQEQLHELNRSIIEGMSVGDGPVYVIGHRSPDADTVCGAVAYARLLNMLGYEAEAVITEPVNRETAFILAEAGVATPPVLEDASGETVFLIDHSEYAQAVEGLEDAHIVANACNASVLRFLPSLIIGHAEVDRLVEALKALA